MRRKIPLLLLTISWFTFSCAGRERQVEVPPDTNLVFNENPRQPPQAAKEWACKAADGLPDTWPMIVLEHRRLHGADDDCVFTIMDSMSRRIQTSDDVRFISLADSIACSADGIKAELFGLILIRTLRSSGDKIVNYITEAETKPQSCLRAVIVASVSRELRQTPGSSVITRRGLDSIAESIETNKVLSIRERRAARRLWADIRDASAQSGD